MYVLDAVSMLITECFNVYPNVHKCICTLYIWISPWKHIVYFQACEPKACISNIDIIVERFPCSSACLRRCNLLVWFSSFSFFLLTLIASSFIRLELNKSPDFSLDYRETEFLTAGILQPGALIPEESRHMGADADRQAFPSATGSNNSDMVLQTTSITAQLKKDDIWLHPWSMNHQNTALVMFQAWFRGFCEGLSVLGCYHEKFD